MNIISIKYSFIFLSFKFFRLYLVPNIIIFSSLISLLFFFLILLIYLYLISVDLTIISKEFDVIFLHNSSRSKSFKGYIILCFILAFSIFVSLIGILVIFLKLSIMVGMTILLFFLNDILK